MAIQDEMYKAIEKEINQTVESGAEKVTVNFEKAKEEGKNLPLSFTFSEIPADGGVPPDDKSGSPPRRTSPHTRS